MNKLLPCADRSDLFHTGLLLRYEKLAKLTATLIQYITAYPSGRLFYEPAGPRAGLFPFSTSKEICHGRICIPAKTCAGRSRSHRAEKSLSESIASDHSLLEIDRELDILFDTMQDELEETGEASQESIERFHMFCDAYGEKAR